MLTCRCGTWTSKQRCLTIRVSLIVDSGSLSFRSSRSKFGTTAAPLWNITEYVDDSVIAKGQKQTVIELSSWIAKHSNTVRQRQHERTIRLNDVCWTMFVVCERRNGTFATIHALDVHLLRTVMYDMKLLTEQDLQMIIINRCQMRKLYSDWILLCRASWFNQNSINRRKVKI